MENILLVVDSREQAIYPYMDGEIHKFGQAIEWVRDVLDAGDYAIIDKVNGRTLAVFERKTLPDFAASFRDNRINNREKMIALRNQCGCRLAFLVETKEIPSPDTPIGKYGTHKTTYGNIESSIFHMFVRDQISTFFTKSTSDTIQFLFRFMKSMATLLKKCKLSDIHPQITSGDSEPQSSESTVKQVVKNLTTKTEKTEPDIVKNIWRQIRGVADSTVGILMENYTLRDLVEGLNPDDLRQLKTASGRAFPQNVVDNLVNIDDEICTKLLSAVPGVSKTTANFLLGEKSLLELVDMGDDICDIVIGSKRFGVKGKNVSKYFLYKCPQQ